MTNPAPLFHRLALIGVGLIGSSIARAARAQGAVHEIVASARSAKTRRRVAELGGDRAALTDRDAHDDEVGAFDRRRIGLGDLVDDAELGHPPAGRTRSGGRCDRPHDAGGPRRARDRRADQTDPDQRQAFEYRLVAHAARPRNSPSAATASRFASSVPTDMRNAFGSL